MIELIKFTCFHIELTAMKYYCALIVLSRYMGGEGGGGLGKINDALFEFWYVWVGHEKKDTKTILSVFKNEP